MHAWSLYAARLASGIFRTLCMPAMADDAAATASGSAARLTELQRTLKATLAELEEDQTAATLTLHELLALYTEVGAQHAEDEAGDSRTEGSRPGPGSFDASEFRRVRSKAMAMHAVQKSVFLQGGRAADWHNWRLCRSKSRCRGGRAAASPKEGGWAIIYICIDSRRA